MKTYKINGYEFKVSVRASFIERGNIVELSLTGKGKNTQRSFRDISYSDDIMEYYHLMLSAIQERLSVGVEVDDDLSRLIEESRSTKIVSGSASGSEWVTAMKSGSVCAVVDNKSVTLTVRNDSGSQVGESIESVHGQHVSQAVASYYEMLVTMQSDGFHALESYQLFVDMKKKGRM